MPSSDNESWIKLLLVIIFISIISAIPWDIPDFTTRKSRISSLGIITLMVFILSIAKNFKEDSKNPVLLYSNLSIGFLLIIGSGLYLLKILLLTEQVDNLRGYIPLNIGIIGIISCIFFYLFYKIGTAETTKFREEAKYLKYKYLMYLICFICVSAIIYGSLNQDKEEDKLATSWDPTKGGILTIEGHRGAWLPLAIGSTLLGGSIYVLTSDLSTDNKKIKYSAIGFICISILFIAYGIWEYSAVADRSGRTRKPLSVLDPTSEEDDVNNRDRSMEDTGVAMWLWILSGIFVFSFIGICSRYLYKKNKNPAHQLKKIWFIPSLISFLASLVYMVYFGKIEDYSYIGMLIFGCVFVFSGIVAYKNKDKKIFTISCLCMSISSIVFSWILASLLKERFSNKSLCAKKVAAAARADGEDKVYKGEEIKGIEDLCSSISGCEIARTAPPEKEPWGVATCKYDKSDDHTLQGPTVLWVGYIIILILIVFSLSVPKASLSTNIKNLVKNMGTGQIKPDSENIVGFIVVTLHIIWVCVFVNVYMLNSEISIGGKIAYPGLYVLVLGMVEYQIARS